jgi:GNAT superfamily N-acetyltransferase
VRIEEQDFTPELAAKLKDLRIAAQSPDGAISCFSKWLAEPESDYAPGAVEVAYQGDVPIGWSGLGKTRGRYSTPIIGVFVLDSLRGQGLGERLIQSALRSYKKSFDPELDDPSIIYDSASWPKLRAMIEAEGFQPRGSDDDYNYPLVAAVLADAPLPELTDPEFWKRNFERTQDRPGKRLGVELRHYLEFHHKEHPKGSYVTDQDLSNMLKMSDREFSRMGLAVQYLIARKALQKGKTPNRYRVI